MNFLVNRVILFFTSPFCIYLLTFFFSARLEKSSIAELKMKRREYILFLNLMACFL